MDQNLGDRQRFFVRYSPYIRNSTYNQYFNNAFVGDQFYFYSKTAAFDHVCHALAHHGVEHALQLQPLHPRRRPARPAPSASTWLRWASRRSTSARFRRTRCASRASTCTGYISNGHTNENRPVNNHTVASTLTKSAGAHSIRTGFEYRVYQESDQFKSNQQTGQFTFGTTWTRGPLDNSAGAPEQHRTIRGRAAAGPARIPPASPASRITSSSPDPGASSCRTTGRSSPKLTVNLGLRYEFETPLHERFNRSTLGFDTTYVQPISAAAQAAYATIYPTISGGFPQLPPSAFALKGGMTFAGLNGNDGGLYNTPKNVFMPRLGIAYQLDSKTVLRSGFGMFAGFLGERRGDVFQNGFTQNTNMVLTKDNGLHFLTTMANPFPNGVAEPVGAAAGYADLPGTGLHLLQPEPEDPGHHPLGSQPAAPVQAVPAAKPTTSATRPTTSKSRATSTRCRRQYLSTLPVRATILTTTC